MNKNLEIQKKIETNKFYSKTPKQIETKEKINNSTKEQLAELSDYVFDNLKINGLPYRVSKEAEKYHNSILEFFKNNLPINKFDKVA
jgi:hypothetical protein